jgi:predicted CoA-binding protein
MLVAVAELTTPAAVEAALRDARVIAVLGAHREPARPAFYVPDYLHEQGYTILPVNPLLAGTTLWGETVRAELRELDRPVDIVDVFRRSDAVRDHLEDILAMSPLPRVVWLQLGIRNDGAAAALAARGIDVVQNRCTLADHRRFRIPPIGA